MCNHIVWGCLFLITSESTSQFRADLTEGERSQNAASSRARWRAGLRYLRQGEEQKHLLCEITKAGTRSRLAATRQPKDQLGRGPPPAATRAGCAVGWEKHACPEGRALQLSRAWRCLHLAHVWAGKDSVCSEPWLPERVELSAETPPAPRSAGAAGSSAGAPRRWRKRAARSGAGWRAPRQVEHDLPQPRPASVRVGSGDSSAFFLLASTLV